MSRSRLMATLVGLFAVSVAVTWGMSASASADDPGYRETSDGRTIGTLPSDPAAEEPDLIKVIGDDGRVGYSENDELFDEPPANPQEALAQQAENDARYAAGERVARVVDVYASDGTTKIDSFSVELTDPEDVVETPAR